MQPSENRFIDGKKYFLTEDARGCSTLTVDKSAQEELRAVRGAVGGPLLHSILSKEYFLRACQRIRWLSVMGSPLEHLQQ